MKFLNKCLLLGIALLSPTLLLAHAKLIDAIPADGAIVNESPDVITVTFNEDVQLLKLTLTGTDGKQVATEFKPSSASQTDFTVALPELAKGSYTVHWTALGADGHKIENSFGFSVDADGAAKPGTTAAETHTEHSH